MIQPVGWRPDGRGRGHEADTGHGGASGARARPGRTGWWLLAALVTLPALVLLPSLVVLAAVVLSDDEYPRGGGPEQVPCAKALRFGGAALPDVAAPAGECTRQSWQDVHYGAVFRMPRTGVRDWLTRTYPDAPAPRTEFCPDEADLCLGLGHEQGLPSGVDADSVQVDVVYEDGGTALVRFSAFTV
ncbi:hypothetical protein ACIRFH_34110 [Streptomyces sp. NPDC093586]|uniref:hypothetical protein n=1 Tax=Streptomyces sp. NPDC093586 TaxID=3366042 RepID=UPI00380E2D11